MKNGKRESRIACLLRTQPVGNDGFFRVVATKSDEGFAGAHAHLLVIHTGFDLDYGRPRVPVGNMVHRLLDRLEVTRSIRRDEDPFGITLARRAHCKQQRN